MYRVVKYILFFCFPYQNVLSADYCGSLARNILLAVELQLLILPRIIGTYRHLY